MYTFYGAKKAATQSHSDGRIIVGLAKTDGDFMSKGIGAYAMKIAEDIYQYIVNG